MTEHRFLTTGDDEKVIAQLTEEYENSTTDEQRARIQERMNNFIRIRSEEGVTQHREFFAKKNENEVVPSRENEEVDVDANDKISEALKHARAKQAVRRMNMLPQMVQDALVNRVHDPGGDAVMKVTFDEFVKINQDPAFEAFGKYARNLLYRRNRDGSEELRAQPIRPFLQNEVGVYKGKIVVVTNMPGEKLSNKFHTVGVDLKKEGE